MAESGYPKSLNGPENFRKVLEARLYNYILDIKAFRLGDLDLSEDIKYLQFYYLEGGNELAIQFFDEDVIPIELKDIDVHFHFLFESIQVSGQLNKPEGEDSWLQIKDITNPKTNIYIIFNYEDIPED